MAKEEQQAYSGLSQLAHAIRRSTAAYVAVQLTPADGTMDDWEATADRVAGWIKGSAGAEQEQPREPRPSLGVRFDDRDGFAG